ncbi:MAG TPA: hypothetical protein VED00_00170 [archaeon]|nr:hypothetical protein [archaeon]
MDKEDAQEIQSWRISVGVILLIAFSLFLYQQFINEIFDYTFSLFIFYVPAVISVVTYIILIRKSNRKASICGSGYSVCKNLI